MAGSCKNDDIICMASALEMKILYYVIFHTATVLMFMDLYYSQVTESSVSSSVVDVMNEAVNAQLRAFMANLTKLEAITRNRSVIIQDKLREAVKNGTYANNNEIALANSKNINITECFKARTFKTDHANMSCQAGVQTCLTNTLEGMFPDMTLIDEDVAKAKILSYQSDTGSWYNVSKAAVALTIQITKDAMKFCDDFLEAEKNLASCTENQVEPAICLIRQAYWEEKLCVREKMKPRLL